MKRPILLLALVATGCSPAAPPPPEADVAATVRDAPPASRPVEAPALPPVTSLVGEWRVAAVDGKSFDEPYGVALSADAQEIWWDPRCAGFARSYRIEGSRLSTGPYIGFNSPKAGEPTPPVCAIAPPPRIGDVFRAIDSARTIGVTPQNGIELSGGGHSLLLFSQ
ncbi:MAG: hypothetical protein M3Q88_02660 [Pseudomonadota bacterium]|nr:hypothetical protein [Pseudomonadota bacterium]